MIERSDQPVAALEQVWLPRPGWLGRLALVNCQPLGVRYMATSLVFFFIGGVMALLIRIQLAVPDNDFLGPDVYNELFTMHGSTMMFLFAVPFLEGLALYVLPLILGSRDLAFPRLSAFSYWCYLFGGLVFYASYIVGTVPDAGWFSYTPLSGPRFSDKALDFWLLGLGMVEVSGIAAGIELVVTILKMRAPGMSLNRMPLLAWALLVTGLMILFAFTVLLTATMLLELDRSLGTRFFDETAGGSHLLWQHLFWFFGHPEVYIMFIPAAGIISMIIPTFSRRPLAAYTLVVVALVIMGFLSFGLWVHHMYTTGLPTLEMNFFAAASLMIAIASGIQVFAWIATMWGTRPRLRTPMLFVLGFLFIFVLGGMTGVMVAIVPFDWQVHDTFFVVAHFHYVLIGGVVFPIMAALHYWLPKVTGRWPSEKLGVAAFGLTFLGFNAAFLPMHNMGILGLPRRVYTYPAELELEVYNLISTAGSFVLGIGFVLMLINVLWTWRRGEHAEANPWGAGTLEWSIPSPVPAHSFDAPPVVRSREPLWDEALRPPGEGDQSGREEARAAATRRAVQGMTGAPRDWRGSWITDAVDGQLQAVAQLPGPSLVPLFAALGLLMTSTAVLMQAYLLAAVGAIVTAAIIVMWLVPSHEMIERVRTSDIVHSTGLPVLPHGTHSLVWWGVVALLACLATGLGALVYSYFFLRLFSSSWPQGGLPRPALGWASVMIAALLLGALAQGAARRGLSRDRQPIVQIGLAGALLAGLIALVSLIVDHASAPFPPQVNAYSSIYFVLGWAFMLMLLVAMGVNIGAQAHVSREWETDEERRTVTLQLQIASLLWWLVTVAGVAVFGTVYLAPHLLG